MQVMICGFILSAQQLDLFVVPPTMTQQFETNQRAEKKVFDVTAVVGIM